MVPEGSSDRLSDDELRAGLKTWVEAVRHEHWQPLMGPARELFLAEGGFSSDQAHMEAVEKCLNRNAEVQHSKIAEADDGDLRDVGTLYRLLECHSGKQIKVADLWSAFTQHSSHPDKVEVKSQGSKRRRETEKSAEEDLKFRFKVGLMSLHHLGIFSPVAGNAQRGVSGWRLRKRLFGRVWLRARQQPKHEVALNAAEEPQPVDVDTSPVKESRPARPELEPGMGSRLKRLPFARQSESSLPPPAFERPGKKPKIFFG